MSSGWNVWVPKSLPVKDGTRILKDAINEALRDWATNMDDTHYVLGTACGAIRFPRWYPIFNLLSARRPAADHGTWKAGCRLGFMRVSGVVPMPWEFSADFLMIRSSWSVLRREAKGLDTGRHASRLASKDGTPGIAQGYKTYFLQNGEGQMRETHSVAAGLDYVGVSPILAASGRKRQEYGLKRQPTRKFWRPFTDTRKRRADSGPGIVPCLCSGI